MDIKKFSQLENFTPTGNVGGVGGLKPQTPDKNGGVSGGPSFAETLGQMQGVQNPLQTTPVTAKVAATPDAIKFSNHAVERMMSRGIHFSKEDVGRLSEAVQKAADKGSKDSLILMNDSALIVSVKNKTVVTVMDKNALKENVFTNIDSTIVM